MGKAPSVVRENQFSAEKRTPSTIICHHDPDLSGEVISQAKIFFRAEFRSEPEVVEVLLISKPQTTESLNNIFPRKNDRKTKKLKGVI